MSEPSGANAAALRNLDEVTRVLRRECPWDREQDERSIVPHTVEEAYELADAAHSGDDAKLLDELGDVLFQVCFLALLLEERSAGGLAAVADHCRLKLIRRHPHVFAAGDAGDAGDAGAAGAAGDAGTPDAASAPAAPDAATVLRNWDEIKRTEAGGNGSIFGDLPETLPATIYARKIQRRAGSRGGLSAGELPEGASPEGASPELAGALAEVPRVCEQLAGALAAPAEREERFQLAGDLLFAAVAVAREAGADPEVALRAAADRFKLRVETGENRLKRMEGR